MGMIAWIALLVLVGVVAWGILSTSAGRRPNNPDREAHDAEEQELKRLRSRGEIDDAEFVRRRAALHH